LESDLKLGGIIDQITRITGVEPHIVENN